MNDNSLNDPQWQSLEARLSAAAPQASLQTQQQMLYACGLAQGRTQSVRRLRRWQAVAATLAVVSLGMGVQFSRERPATIVRTTESPAPQQAVPATATPLPAMAQVDIPIGARQAAPVPLDAWESNRSDDTSLAEDLDRFQRADPTLRSLAMGAMTRAMLQQ
jgi:hypothetical protein